MSSNPNKEISLSAELEGKYRELTAYFRTKHDVAVAFSGGVDSALLLGVAHLQPHVNVVAITAQTPTFPSREIEEAKNFCEQFNIRQVLFQSNAYNTEAFRANPPHRCYLCKQVMLDEVTRCAHELGIDCIVEGSHADDLNEDRPGRAALEQSCVESPLCDLGFSKQDIRTLAHALALPNWNKPSFSCLATRIAQGQAITDEKLARIDAAEQLLIDQGFSHIRVRMSNNTARIEVNPAEVASLIKLNKKENLTDRIRALGFTEVTIDPNGYVRRAEP